MTNPLGDLISKGEGGYNSYNRGTKDHRILPGNQAIDFSAMTLDELQRRQRLPLADPNRIFAVGKYQLIPSTMKETINHLKLPGDARFTPELQERMFSDHLIREKRPEIYSYIVGELGASLHRAQKAVSNEWASVDDPDTPGRPAKHYFDVGNRSSTRAAQVAVALNEMRSNYEADLEAGMSPSEAWRSVTGQIQPRKRGVEEQKGIETIPAKGSTSSAPSYSDHENRGSCYLEAQALQKSLAALGYHDAHGRPLVADGTLGPHTLHAIKSFQHAHHLHVDGIVGPRTLAALEDAKRYPLLSEATNPHHRMYSQIVEGIHALPRDAQPTGRALENAAVALTVSAATSGLKHVDHVVIGSNGVNLFAVQGRMDDPAHRRAYVELTHAVEHAADHRALSAALQPADSHAHAMAVAQQQSAPRAPVMANP